MLSNFECVMSAKYNKKELLLPHLEVPDDRSYVGKTS